MKCPLLHGNIQKETDRALQCEAQVQNRTRQSLKIYLDMMQIQYVSPFKNKHFADFKVLQQF